MKLYISFIWTSFGKGGFCVHLGYIIGSAAFDSDRR